MVDQNNSTQQDDAVDNRTEEQMLTDILRGSEVVQHATGDDAPPPPPQGSQPEEHVLENSDEIVSDDDLEEPIESAPATDDDESEIVDEEVETEDNGDAEATEVESYALDELEDIQVTHKIDGEEITLPLSEWIAGSATKQHLSKQGRELGEARKQLDAERSSKIGELEQLGAVVAQEIYSKETKLQTEYHKITQDIAKAEQDDDDYEIGKLSKKQKSIQQEYWDARGKREAMIAQVANQKQAILEAQFQKEMVHFNDTITDIIPDWGDDVQQDLRKFAIDKGLPEQLVDRITDPNLVKFVDEFRRLEKGVAKGAVKRNAAVKKKVPAKKAKPDSQKKKEAKNMVKARAFKKDASKQDQVDYLKSLTSLGS